MTDENHSRPLNQFDDTVIETTGSHGADIASQRIDELDEAALRYALDVREESVSAVDIGCGLGAQGFRFSLVGVDTTLVDILDISERIDVLNSLFEIGSLRYVEKDARELAPGDLPANLGIVYSQRFIHYLTWEEASDLLSLLNERLQDGGRIFISASGLNTELGQGYPDTDVPPEDRYSKLESAVADKHDIHQKVCLYERADMERLLTETGFQPLSLSTSGFGNIKAIAEA